MLEPSEPSAKRSSRLPLKLVTISGEGVSNADRERGSRKYRKYPFIVIHTSTIYHSAPVHTWKNLPDAPSSFFLSLSLITINMN